MEVWSLQGHYKAWSNKKVIKKKMNKKNTITGSMDPLAKN